MPKRRYARVGVGESFYKMESGGEEVIRTHQVAQPLGAISCACVTLGLKAINWYRSHNYAFEIFSFSRGQTSLTLIQLRVIAMRNDFTQLLRTACPSD